VAEFVFPGVFVEETPSSVKPIKGVPTGTAAMVGATERGPDHPLLVTSFAAFAREFGTAVSPSPDLQDKWASDQEGGQWWHFPLAVKGFFENGGQRLYVKQICRENLNDLTVDDFVLAIDSLNEVEGVSLCLAPGVWSWKVHDALIKRCETRRDCFTILDPPTSLDVTGILNFRRRLNTSFAALYYPWIEVAGLDGRSTQKIGPSAHVAGIYARVDEKHGVHKAPANEVIMGMYEIPALTVTTREQSLLNPEGINTLRSRVVWGARTLSRDPEWKYVNVRRLFIFLEHSIDSGTQWAVFEPNDEALWAKVRQNIANFLTRLWRDGALQGIKPEEAFFVKCDRSTITQDGIDQGRLVCLIGVAPLKPAEFVIFRIGQWTADRKD
jgi:uncharacterized protein